MLQHIQHTGTRTAWRASAAAAANPNALALPQHNPQLLLFSLRAIVTTAKYYSLHSKRKTQSNRHKWRSVSASVSMKTHTPSSPLLMHHDTRHGYSQFASQFASHYRCSNRNKQYTSLPIYMNIAAHSYSNTTDEKTQVKKKDPPLLNRVLRTLSVGPKIYWFLERSGAIVDPSILSLISNTAAVGIYAFGLITSMTYFNIDTTAFIAGFSFSGAALGFGMKDIAHNYMAGVLLALQQLFSRGDIVTVAGSYTGEVVKQNLRHLTIARIKDDDSGTKEILYIPNSAVFDRPIIVHKKVSGVAVGAMETKEEMAD